MRLRVIFAIIFLWFLIFALVFIIINQPLFTGEAIQTDKYTYTKAICNDSNYCQDYTIVCEGGNLVDISPVTGAAIQKPADWVDSREDKSLC